MATKPLTKKAQKEAEAAAYVARVEAALAEAHVAAKGAYDAFAAKAKRTPEGHILDSCGGAFVVIYKPSYRFRKTLERWVKLSVATVVVGTSHVSGSTFQTRVPRRTKWPAKRRQRFLSDSFPKSRPSMPQAILTRL